MRASTIGLLAACVHASLLVVAIAAMSPPSPGLGEYFDSGGGSSATLFAGRPFHFVYESLILKLLVLADIPATLVRAAVLIPVGLVLKAAGVGSYVASYVDAAGALLFGSVQWFLVGRYVESRILRSGGGDRLVQTVSSSLKVVIPLIGILTLIIASWLNAPSAELGIGHSGISFW